MLTSHISKLQRLLLNLLQRIFCMQIILLDFLKLPCKFQLLLDIIISFEVELSCVSFYSHMCIQQFKYIKNLRLNLCRNHYKTREFIHSKPYVHCTFYQPVLTRPLNVLFVTLCALSLAGQ